jgi:hypothetical protein
MGGVNLVTRITINQEKQCFVQGDRPFFYLADTAWSAFTNATLDEWKDYLDYRKRQGFNAVQINILPQWDRSESEHMIHPVAYKEDETWDFRQFNEDYFAKVEKMLAMMKEREMVPSLIVLWVNHVPDTWGAEKVPESVIPFEHLEGYVSMVVERFKRFEPIYMISGDTNFPSEQAIHYYLTALEVTKKVDPEALTTLHLQPDVIVPDDLIQSSHLDFYMYQSSHNRHFHKVYEMAQQFINAPIKRPIVNGEPCYEDIAKNRITGAEVRLATWLSLLGGAQAGVTYGAHGIWSWHKEGQRFWPGEGWGEAKDWREALLFPGAWDAAYAKWIFEIYNLFDLKPRQELLIECAIKDVLIAATANEDKILIYMPKGTKVSLSKALKDYRWDVIDLQTRCVTKPKLTLTDTTLLDATYIIHDALIIGTR